MASALLIAVDNYSGFDITTEMWCSISEPDPRVWLNDKGIFDNDEMDKLLKGEMIETEEEYPCAYKFVEV